MATILVTAIVADIRGRIDGTVFSKTKGLNTMRPFGQRARRPTNKQLPRRANWNFLSKEWSQTLIPTFRTGWDAWAAGTPKTNSMGTEYFMSGFNAFCGFNSGRIQIDAPVRQTPPSGTGFGPGLNLQPIQITVSASAGTVSIPETAIPFFNKNTEDDGAILQISAQHNAGVIAPRFAFTGLASIRGDSSTPPTFPVVVDYPLGILTLGNKVFVRARAVAINGKLSNIEEGTILVAA